MYSLLVKDSVSMAPFQTLRESGVPVCQVSLGRLKIIGVVVEITSPRLGK